MKKLLEKIGVIAFGIVIAISISGPIGAANIAQAIDSIDCETTGGVKSPLCSLNEVGSDSGLSSYTGAATHPDAIHTIEPGVSSISSPIFFALDAFKLAVTSIAIIVMIVASIRLVSHSTDEEASKAKRSMLYGVIGLLTIQMADPLVRQGFLGEAGDAFDQGRVEESGEAVVTYLRGIIGFVQVLLGAAAVMILVMRGFTLITNSGDEEAITKARKHVLYAIVGLAVVGLSEIVVRGFVFPEQGESLPDTRVAAQLIASVTNYIASFVAILAFISLFVSGYRYVVSGGNEEVTDKVKKSALGAVIALVLSAGAFGLVNTIVNLDNTGDSVANQEIGSATTP